MSDWVSICDVKLYFNIAPENTARDRAIQANITRAQALILDKLGGGLDLFGTFANVVETLTAPVYSEKIFIRNHPHFDTLVHAKLSGVLMVADSDFISRPGEGSLEKIGGYWPTTPNAIEIKYNITRAVPEDLKLALIEYTGVLSNIKTKTFVTGEGIEQTVTQGIPEAIMDILERHRVPRFIMHQ